MWTFLGLLAASAISSGVSIWSANQARKANRSDAAQQNEWNKENYIYQQTHGPSLTREGLEKAGYNPLLAVSGGVDTGSIASAQMANSTQADLGGLVSSAKMGAMLGKELDSLSLQNEQTEKENSILDTEKEIKGFERDIAEAMRDASVVELGNRESEASAISAALKGLEPTAGSPTWQNLRRAYIKGAESEEYSNSRWRRILGDVLDTVHGASSAYGDVFRKKNKLGR